MSQQPINSTGGCPGLARSVRVELRDAENSHGTLFGAYLI